MSKISGFHSPLILDSESDGHLAIHDPSTLSSTAKKMYSSGVSSVALFSIHFPSFLDCQADTAGGMKYA